jgi:hypothetical protein
MSILKIRISACFRVKRNAMDNIWMKRGEKDTNDACFLFLRDR